MHHIIFATAVIASAIVLPIMELLDFIVTAIRDCCSYVAAAGRYLFKSMHSYDATKLSNAFHNIDANGRTNRYRSALSRQLENYSQLDTAGPSSDTQTNGGEHSPSAPPPAYSV